MSASKEQPEPEDEQVTIRAELANLLVAVLPSEHQLDAFCRRCFPDIHGRFTNEMNRAAKTAFLLSEASPSEVLDHLRMDFKWSFRQVWEESGSYPGYLSLRGLPVHARPQTGVAGLGDRPRRVFLTCADEDDALFHGLLAQLSPLRRRGMVELWHPRLVPPGEDRRQYPMLYLEEADLALLLVSADYLASDEFEFLERPVLLRHRQGLCEAHPILVRPCQWQQTSLADLSPLPSDGRPITSWPNQDEALLDVADGIRRAIKFSDGARHSEAARPPQMMHAPWAVPAVAYFPPSPLVLPMPRAPLRPAGQPQLLPIEKIFQVKGQPESTYVEPDQSAEIRDRLRNMGHGLVVDGPSGVGKTTAVKKALEVMGGERPLLWIGGKKKGDVARLREALDSDFRQGGYLVVDDFHRLERGQQQELADLIKILADDNRDDAKVTLIGINPVGVSLVKDFPDLANRFAVIHMGRQPDEKIEELIEKGERAANVLFRQRPEFVAMAAGSFFTAQLLCYEAALKAGIRETQDNTRTIDIGPRGYVSDKVEQNLAFKYHDPLLVFASCDERPPPRGACLALLWLLAQAKDKSVSLETARHRYPQLAPAFDWLMQSHLSRRFQDHPRLAELFYYNRDAAVLSLEDPQLEFYLRNMKWEALGRDTGHEKLHWDPVLGPVAADAPERERPPVPGPLPEPLSLPESFILHLSDLHFGTREQAAIWSVQLIQDLRLELSCQRLDAVVLSGDIANRATLEEYQAAAQFLLDLKQEFRLSPQQLILVPGNHDVSWTQSKDAYRPVRREDHTGPLEEGSYIAAGAYVELRDDEKYRERFKAFADFYYQIRVDDYSLEYEKQATLHHFPAQQLLIVGLNSAWALDHHFKGRAGINQVALGQVLRKVQQTGAYADCLRIAIWHHPLHSSEEDRIKDTGFLELLSQAGFRLALHGHIHREAEELFRYDMIPAGRRIDILGAGTFGAPVKEWVPGCPLQYQLLKVAGRRLTVMTRARDKLNGAWKPYARWQQGPGKDPLPRYEIEL